MPRRESAAFAFSEGTIQPTMIQLVKENKGQSLVEIALVLPVFLVLLALAVDGGRAYHRYMQVQHVARAAAFYGASHDGDVAATEDMARSFAEEIGLDTSSLDVEVTVGQDTDEYIVVTASYRMNTIMLGIAGYRALVLSDSAKAMVSGAGS